jgi:hypothetical protein
MFTPHSLEIALFMMITSAICWGSWANTYKGVKNYRFELFYWDYAVGIFLVSLILALTMGSTGHDANSFLNNVRSADTSNIVSTMVGGTIFNLANLLLVAAIDMAGLAIAFPVAIGIALVVGVISSYALQPKGNAALLAGGVLCALIAVVLDGKAYGSLAIAGRAVSKKSIVVCVVSGVLMGLWAPFVAHAMTTGNTLGPYSIAVFPHAGRAALVSDLECLFHEAPARRPAGKFQRLLQRTRLRATPSDCSADSSGASAWFSIWSPPASPASPSPTPSANPRPWSPLSGESSPGRNLRAHPARPSCTSSSCSSSTAWESCWWPKQTAEVWGEQGKMSSRPIRKNPRKHRRYGKLNSRVGPRSSTAS